MIRKWLNIIQEDLGCFADLDLTYERLVNLHKIGALVVEEVAGGDGVIACTIFDNWFGKSICSELVVYIKPDKRGNSRLLMKMIKRIEKIAEERGCNEVHLGATIGYKDDSVLNVYKRMGYETMGVSKLCVQVQKR